MSWVHKSVRLSGEHCASELRSFPLNQVLPEVQGLD